MSRPYSAGHELRGEIMDILENLSLPGLDIGAGTLTLPLWAAGLAAALLLLFLLLAIFRAKLAGVVGTIVALAAVAFVIWAGWTLIEQGAERDRAGERRALDERASELGARAIAPASALACLDGLSGEATETACERAVFASPESVAAATSYVAAQITLFQDGIDFANRREARYAASLVGLRRAIEVDRFGIAAHVLMTREGCTTEQCAFLSLLRDANRIRANLNERAFDGFVSRYAAGWPARSRPNAASATTAPGPGISFPSAASIPPVSIMNSEPPAAPAAVPAQTAPPAAPAPPARPRPAPAAAQKQGQPPRSAGPVQLAPPPPSAGPPQPARSQ